MTGVGMSEEPEQGPDLQNSGTAFGAQLADHAGELRALPLHAGREGLRAGAGTRGPDHGC